MNILFDQGTPVPLRRYLAEHSVTTAYEQGWSDLANGQLLAAALLHKDRPMLKTVEGVYRNGKIELLEVPHDFGEELRVIITFLPALPQRVDLAARGIDAAQASDLRAQLQTFAVD